MREGEDSRPAQCRSCDEPLHGHYCSACGESHVYARLELGALTNDLLDGLLNLDTRVLRTVGELTVEPATVCRNYIAGRRKRYIHPFKYALATLALGYAIAEAWIYLHGAPADPKLALSMRWGQLLNVLAMPVLALVMLPLFPGSNQRPRLTLVEHFVVVLFAFGHIALLQGLLNPVTARLGSAGEIGLMLVALAYLSWVAVGVYETRWWTTIPRVVIALGIMQLVVGGVFSLLTG